ncbi:inverse autotransporter beta domain-containing protein, partial [Escherichia coli]|uniref:inverse autotransporter beta domain-containing protein n=1 Tax=Escherichia coli TaxID=562 RepID=UPI00202393AC
NPTCDGYEIEEGEFRIKGYDGPIVECEKCGSEMHLKMGRFGNWARGNWLVGYNTFYDNLLDENLQRAGFGAEAWGEYLRLSANF